MKKVFSLLAVLAVTVFMASSVWAAVSITKASIADFSTSGEVSLEFTLKAISNGASKDNIEWDIANIPLNQVTTQWTTSTVYAELTATVTQAGGAIYMYQKNTAEGTYQATTPRHDGTKTLYSGMVNIATKGGDNKGFIPMAYQIAVGQDSPVAPDFGTNPEGLEGARYFKDYADSDFSTSTNYVTIANLGGLVKGINDDGCYGFDTPTFSGNMYFGGLFSNVYGGETYGTDKIKIVSSIE